MSSFSQEILRLIEAAHHSNTGQLDDIDVRVSCYVHCKGAKFGGWKKPGQTYYQESPSARTLVAFDEIHPRYTRSRDALKVIRPEGWMILEHGQSYVDASWVTVLINAAHGSECAMVAPESYTEELSELHALIQAIAFERWEL